jgi:UDP-N-acetylmuramoyl-L-alanyl-D-glutamate--2,6-diaminopimelate ligase
VPTLREALTGLPAVLHGPDDVVVSGVNEDSRTIRPGDIFVALRGLTHDGHRYVADAVARGARAIVSEQAPSDASALPWATVPDARAALGWLAASFHGFPSRRLGVIGVTGTDGKTTTAHLIAEILAAAGWSVGHVSTVHLRLGDEVRTTSTDFTTPPAPVLQALLAEMVGRGLHWVVLEVSSHALDQMRVAGCFFDIGVFTNLTPEHLNYHESFEHYRQTKAQLFAALGREPKDGVATFGVFNADDPSSALLRAVCPVEQLTYGTDAGADYRAAGVALDGGGTAIELATPGGRHRLWMPLEGDFNVYNAAAASAVGLRLGVPAEAVERALRGFQRVPGRLQRIEGGGGFQVYVDFAHTPNALRAVLDTLRARTARRLILVFGHPGGRDFYNRPELGRVAAALADLVVLTADDPYDEDPQAILGQMEAGLLAAGRRPDDNFLRIDDRAEAIATALRLAGPGDTVLIAGRGHLDYTVVRGRKSPLSDVAIAQQELEKLRATTPS